MDNQNPSVNPPVENPVQPLAHIQSTITPPPPKSFLSNKLLLIVIILIILLGAGGTYLALNSQHKPVPTVSKATSIFSPTPTIDPTTSWKTYTNLELKYSLKYPPDWNAITDGSLKINGIRTSIGPNATGGFEDFNTKVSITAITPGLNTNISSAKDLMVVGNPPPKVYPTIETITFKGLKVYKKIQEDSSDLIAFDKDGLVYLIYLFHRSHIDNVDPKIYDQILSTFKFTDASQSTDTSNWKTFENSKFSIKYPSNWIIDNSYPDQFDIAFKSSDYVMSQAGYPNKGFTVTLFMGKTPFSGTLGLISTTQTVWLGESAKLQVYKYEANNLVVTTKHNNVDYQMVLTASSDEVRDLNKEIFLKVANSLNIK